MAGTPSNYEKILEDWFTEEFIPACAAYAVFYDFSDWEKLYTKQNGVNMESRLSIRDGALTKKGTYEAYKKVQKAAAEAGMARSSGEGAQLITDAVAGAQAFADYADDRPDSELQAVYDAKLAALGAPPYDADVIAGLELAKSVEKSADKSIAFFNQLKDDPRMFGPVLDAILKLQEAEGFEDLLWAIWIMTRRFKFSNDRGTTSWTRSTAWPDSDALVQFNIIISTIIRNPEDPGLGFMGRDTTNQLRKNKYGLDGSGKGTPLMDTFAPFFKPKLNSWVPLCYTAPYVAPYELEGRLGYGEAYAQGDIEGLKPGEQAGLLTTAGTIQYVQRYLLDRGAEPAREDSGGGLMLASRPAPSPWSAADSVFPGTTPGVIPGSRGRVFSVEADGDVSDMWTGEYPPTMGGASCYALQGGAIFYYFQQLVLKIGKSSKVKSNTTPRRPWYEAIAAEILGAAAPRPRRRRGASRKPSKPKNEGKAKKLGKGEIHVTDFQCVLLENIKKLAALRDASPYKTLGKIGGAMPGNVVSKLNHGAEGIGKRATWPPTAGGPDGEAYAMQNMCPDIWALMTPHIELFRVSYSGSAGMKQTPVEEHQIPFSNFIDQSNINEITAGTYGRQGGAGIKSFTWSLDGTQPAEVDNMITANLVMHFQSVYDLFRHNEIPGKPGQYAAGISGQPGYLDLIIGSGVQGRPANPQAPEEEPSEAPASCENLVSQIYKGENFRIKAIVGWSTPPDFTNMEIPGYSGGILGDLGNIQSAIEGSRKALYLQITSHQINFQQDGTLELSINYQASLSGIMRTPRSDIFIGKEVSSEKMEALNQELAELVETADDSSAEDTTREKKRAELLDKQAQLMRKARIAKYTVFLKTLRDKNKIRGIVVDTKELLAGGFAKMTPEERIKVAKIRASRALDYAEPASAAAVAEANGQELSDSLEATADVKGDPAENEELKAMAANLSIFNTKKSKTTTIPFFYLGDLIDVVMGERLNHLIEKDGSGASPLQMMLGPVELIDPLAAFQIETVTFACPNATTEQRTVQLQLAKIDPLRFRKISGISTTMNIGSIPISTHAFDDWFAATVVRGNIDSYFLLNFIKDVCSGLISKAYGSQCFKDLFQYNIKFDTATFRMADDFQGQTKTINELGRSAREAHINDRHRLTADPESPPPSIPTVVLYPVSSRPSVGDRASDMVDGIYHYFLGGRCGLAKEINFTRQDMPFYREARIDKDGSLGAQQLKELYTVQLSMIGNTLHKNGTYIYIDPIAIGAGSARAIGGVKNIARLIGLGGYFLVNSVSNELTPSSYNTTVSAMQEMSAFDEGMDERIVGINGNDVEANEPALEDNPDDSAGDDDTASEGDASANEAGDMMGDGSGVMNTPAEDAGAAAEAAAAEAAAAEAAAFATAIELYAAEAAIGADLTEQLQATRDRMDTELALPGMPDTTVLAQIAAEMHEIQASLAAWRARQDTLTAAAYQE
jgi:hypothetical protein